MTGIIRLNRTLLWVRVIVSVAVLAILTLGLTIYGQMLPLMPGWLSEVQLLPAAAGFALGVFVVWIAITLLFGRVYCSTVCPLGTAMDLIARLRTLCRPPHRFRRRDDYRYHRPLNALRYLVLVVVLTCLIGGLMIVPAILDPYTVYERFCRGCLSPVYEWLGGTPLSVADSAAVPDGFYLPLQIAMCSTAGAVVGLGSMLLVGIVAWRGGRTLCNTLCPVGTTLGIVSRFAVFQPDIDTDKCIQCRKCADVCKASCIDLTDHVVDGSRCVNCFNCINVCPNDAIRYTATRKQLSVPMMQRVDSALRPRELNPVQPEADVCRPDSEQ